MTPKKSIRHSSFSDHSSFDICHSPFSLSRRAFLAASAATLSGCCHHSNSLPATSYPLSASSPIIDIHQHTHYSGRTDDLLISHQQNMGVTHSVLLPAGQYVKRPSTHNGLSNGLAAAILTWESAKRLVDLYPKRFSFFANEVPDLDDAKESIEKQLAAGAIGIGEQKFNVDCDSPEMQRIFDIANHHGVPVLMHIQHDTYNKHFERFYTMLEKYPKVNFIGHAQTFWANIDKAHADQTILYPKTKVTPGGLTDRYLSDYPNMFADMSAGSGLNALTRDEGHAREFIKRHQDKLIYGSDCNDHVGTNATTRPATMPSTTPATMPCQGAATIAAIRKLADLNVQKKIFNGNIRRLVRIPI